MMIKVIDIDNITKQLYQIFYEFYEQQVNYLTSKGYKSVWFDISHPKYKVTFTRKYSVLENEEYSILEVFLYIDKFIQELDFTGKGYVNIEIFGNGISFNSFIDLYDIMNED